MNQKTTIFVVTLPLRGCNKSFKSIQEFFDNVEAAHEFVMSELTRYKVDVIGKVFTKTKFKYWEYTADVTGYNVLELGMIVEKELRS